MNLTIYVPDDLGERIKKADVEVSRICQQALSRVVEEKELAKATGGKMKRIEVEVGTPKAGLYTKAFRGKWLVEPQAIKSAAYREVAGKKIPYSQTWGVALTQKGKFLVYEGNGNDHTSRGEEEAGGELHVFDSLAEAQGETHVPTKIIEEAFSRVGPLRTGRVVELDV